MKKKSPRARAPPTAHPVSKTLLAQEQIWKRNSCLLSLHRWQYPSAWSANWCWMIA